MLVGDIGEEALLRRIADRLPPSPEGEIWSGDDAAVVTAPGDRMVFTTDFMVEGVDFDLAYVPSNSIGWKAIAVNASDVAAMGGVARVAVASLSLRPDLDVSFVDGVLDGLVKAGEEFGVTLVGGDLSRADEIMLSVAMTGTPTELPVLRSGAAVGDAICVTGSLGGAAAGLRVLRGGEGSGNSDVIARQLYPRPPVEAGPVIARSGATSMIDISDGFARDLGRILRASDVGCDIATTAIPVDEAARGLFPEDALELALSGGEDFELLFTVPSARLEDVVGALQPLAVSEVGRVTEGAGQIDGEPLARWEERGWDHLLGR